MSEVISAGPEARDRLLEAIYDDVGGVINRFTNVVEVGAHIGLNEEVARAAVQFLTRKRYLEHANFGGTASMSTSGIEYVERMRERRQRMSDSHPVLAVFLTDGEKASVEAALGELDRADVAARLEGDDLATFEADRQTAAAQLRAPRPIRAVLKPLLKRLAGYAVAVSAGYVSAKLDSAL